MVQSAFSSSVSLLSESLPSKEECWEFGSTEMGNIWIQGRHRRGTGEEWMGTLQQIQLTRPQQQQPQPVAWQGGLLDLQRQAGVSYTGAGLTLGQGEAPTWTDNDSNSIYRLGIVHRCYCSPSHSWPIARSHNRPSTE